MLRHSRLLSLRHITSIIPKAGNVVQRVSELSDVRFGEFQANATKFSSQTDWYESREEDAERKNLVSLRIGGAKVLAPANRPVLAQSERSPLHFSPVRPRDAGLCQALCASLIKLNIKRLTELQGALVPMLLRGRHVIGHAETGSGKSFGIALAACNRMLREQTTNRLHTMILVPTDALALQYERWLRHFAGSSRQIVLAAVSQYPLEHQLAQLHNVQPHVIVGTPQRLADIASLCPVIIGEKMRKKVDCIVLDEVDVLLNTPITPPSKEDENVASRFAQQLSDEGLGKNSDTIETCSELIDRLYRSEMTELPAQIVAVSATVDGESAARLNTWMRNDSVTRLTTSVEEQAVPDTLSFYFACENVPQNYHMHNLLHLFLQHIACQTAKPRILIFADDKEFDLNDLVRYVSELPIFPKEVLERVEDTRMLEFSSVVNNNTIINNNNASTSSAITKKNNNRWKVVSLQQDFEQQTQEEEQNNTQMNSSSSGDNKHHNNNNYHQKQQRQPLQSTMANNTNRRIVGRNGEIFSFNDSNLSQLESYRAQIGVAPFSLARGLHIANVSHVIIFGDAPGVNEFLHCSGRTGRRQRKGEVINIFSPSGGRKLKSIADTLGLPWHVIRPVDVEKNLRHSIEEIVNKKNDNQKKRQVSRIDYQQQENKINKETGAAILQ